MRRDDMTRFLTAMAVASSLWPGVTLAAARLTPGEYVLTTRMLMPHLDEMRRIEKHAVVCVTRGTPEELFPVLAQPALRGCVLAYEAVRATGREYILTCASARVATGKARVSGVGERFEGLLEVKMGGKNMTFSQHISAARRADCVAPAAP
jgi:hypothetical protein